MSRRPLGNGKIYEQLSRGRFGFESSASWIAADF